MRKYFIAEKQNIRSLMAMVLLSLLTIAGHAQVPEQYLQMAAENNGRLRSEYELYLAELQRVPQVGALPDPQVNFGFFTRPMERFMGEQVASVGLMQMFPWFGTLSAAKNEASQMARARFHTFRETRSQVLYEVKEAWYAIYLIDKEIAITGQNMEILKSLEQMSISRYASGGGAEAGGRSGGQKNMTSSTTTAGGGNGGGMAGMGAMGGNAGAGNAQARQKMPTSMDNMGSASGGSMVDVLKLQIELRELESRAEQLQDDRQVLLARFHQLIGAEGTSDMSLPDTLNSLDLPLPLAQLPDSIKEHNPMLQMLEAEEQAFLAMQDMSRRMGRPMFGIGLQYDVFRPRASMGHGDVLSDMNGSNMLMPMVSVTLPIWRGKYKGAVSEAQHKQDATQARQHDLQQQLMVSLEDIQKDHKNTMRKIRLSQDKAQLARQMLNINTTAYATGEKPLDDVLRNQQQLLDIELEHQASLVENHLTVATMERLLGR